MLDSYDIKIACGHEYAMQSGGPKEPLRAEHQRKGRQNPQNVHGRTRVADAGTLEANGAGPVGTTMQEKSRALAEATCAPMVRCSRQHATSRYHGRWHPAEASHEHGIEEQGHGSGNLRANGVALSVR
jgi:hypothetical protein